MNAISDMPPVPASESVEYRYVARFPGYCIGSDGSVWSCWKLSGLAGGGFVHVMDHAWKMLKPLPDKRGYLRVGFRSEQGMKRLFIHQVVLETFVGPRPVGYLTRHLNGDPTDNRPENLAWGTEAENAADRTGHGRTTKGRAWSKLTASQVQEIRRLAPEVSRAELARRFEVTHGHVVAIVNNKYWKPLPAPPAGAESDQQKGT